MNVEKQGKIREKDRRSEDDWIEGWNNFFKSLLLLIDRQYMESSEVTVNIVIYLVKNSLNRILSQKIISYLNNDDLTTFIQGIQSTEHEAQFAQLLHKYFFIRNYLNRTDRSMHYTFYEQYSFKKVQEMHFISLSSQHSKYFNQYTKQYTKAFNLIKSTLPNIINLDELTQQIQRMLFDPDLPLPRLKRENQGIFCKTPFQNFLVSLKSARNQFNELPEIFQDLKQYFEIQDQMYLKKLFLKCNKDKLLSTKVKLLRFTPYEITFETKDDFLCEKNSLHNFLVSIYAISDIWLNSTYDYLASLDDPFHLYIQLITRYSIYRNFVISVEQNLYFAFEKYDELFSEVFANDKPKYRFWRSAMTKWLKKMNSFHPRCQQVYIYCFTKLRMKNLLNSLQAKESQLPALYMQDISDIGFRPIRTQLALEEHELQINKLIEKNRLCNEVENFFQENQEQYQVIVIEYLEYLVDLSINEETVHWGGHSKQPLSSPYKLFEKEFLLHNKTFLHYLLKCKTSQLPVDQYMKDIFMMEEEFFHKIQIKPVLLREVIHNYNSIINETEENILNEEVNIIKYSFQTNDGLLKYFNQKAKIKFIIREQQLCFYSINPLVPVNQLLSKSISTNYDSHYNEDDDQSQCQKCENYYSEGECSDAQKDQFQLTKSKIINEIEYMTVNEESEEAEIKEQSKRGSI